MLSDWPRCGVEFGVCHHAFCHCHVGSADDACDATVGESPTFRLDHMYVYGSKTDVDSSGDVVGGALALG